MFSHVKMANKNEKRCSVSLFILFYFLMFRHFIIFLESAVHTTTQAILEVLQMHFNERFRVIARLVKGALVRNGVNPIHIVMIQEGKGASPVEAEDTRTMKSVVADGQNVRDILPVGSGKFMTITGHDFIAIRIAMDGHLLDAAIHVIMAVNLVLGK
jgi:hypothetical protein